MNRRWFLHSAALGVAGAGVALAQPTRSPNDRVAVCVMGVRGRGSSLLSTFAGGGVPTYFFQVVVGFYVVEIVYVLTILVNGIENGADVVGERTLLGKNLVQSTLTYAVLAFFVMMAFNMVAGNLLPLISSLARKEHNNKHSKTVAKSQAKDTLQHPWRSNLWLYPMMSWILLSLCVWV